MRLVITIDVIVVLFNILFFFTPIFKPKQDNFILAEDMPVIEEIKKVSIPEEVEETTIQKETEEIVHSDKIQIYRDVATESEVKEHDITKEHEIDTASEIEKANIATESESEEPKVIKEEIDYTANNESELTTDNELSTKEAKIVFGQNPEYNGFLKVIATRHNIRNNAYAVDLINRHKDLIIGDSLVVGFPLYMKAINYDIICVKGSYIANCLNWLKALDHKHLYDNIIIWSGSNDAVNSYRISDYSNNINKVIDEALTHITDNGKVTIVINQFIADSYNNSISYNTNIMKQQEIVAEIAKYNSFVKIFTNLPIRTFENSSYIFYRGIEPYQEILNRFNKEFNNES